MKCRHFQETEFNWMVGSVDYIISDEGMSNNFESIISKNVHLIL